MNFGGNNNSQSYKTKDKRAPLNNISARKNQMDYESSEYSLKQISGTSQTGDFNGNLNASNILAMKSNVFGLPNQNKQNQASQMETKQNQQLLSDLEKLKFALKDAIDENEILRNRVTELEALYAAAEDEIEKRDKCILELVEQLQKQSETESIINKQSKNKHKRTHSH
ncbi:hypothetical protein ABPG72_017872 [Tetrahymena utriculariae]